MSMQDPIADMIVRIKNAQRMAKVSVQMGSSKIKIAIADVLKSEGYISEYQVVEQVGQHKKLVITLKYHLDKPVIENIRRISRPGLRVYKHHHELPKVMDGLGVAIVSTPKGVKSDRAARLLGEGGEILCFVN